jgi:hypothetical protein
LQYENGLVQLSRPGTKTDRGHGPSLYQSGLPSTRRLELVSAKPLKNGAVAMHYRRALTQSEGDQHPRHS